MKYYSNETNGFYDSEIHGDDIPHDAVEIADGAWMELLVGQADGKIISADASGYPVLIATPPMTKEQNIEQAEAKKQRLISEASEEIAPLQDAVDLDMATDEEAAALKEWKKFRVLVNRVDTSLAPDIEWPEMP